MPTTPKTARPLNLSRSLNGPLNLSRSLNGPLNLSRSLNGRRPKTIAIAVLVLVLSLGAVAVPQLASAATNHKPFGRVDTISFANGTLNVSGWTMDPDTHSSIRSHIYVGKRGYSILANSVRKDVGKAYPAYGARHGISLSVPVANGTYTVCVYGINVGTGSNTKLACRQVTVSNNPVGAVTGVTRVPSGLKVTGWSLDPNTTAAINTDIYVDGAGTRLTANLATSTSLSGYAAYGTGHGFQAIVAATAGTHKICVFGINVGTGANTLFSCKAITVSNNPIGKLDTITRVNATTMKVGGWAIDPDTTASTSVSFTVDDIATGATSVTNTIRTDVDKVYPDYAGHRHGFSNTVTVDAYEHQVCLIAVNASSTLGADSRRNCVDLPAQNATAPGAPTNVEAWPGNTTAIVGWTSPNSNGGAAITGYLVTTSPGGRSVAVSSSATQATIAGLTNGTSYTFTVQARNIKGYGTSAVTAAVKPSPIPAQITSPPVSISHYIRDITGKVSTDAALMKKRGAADASHGTSGHRYLTLLQIGGQDMSSGGVLLSATSRFVSNAAVVSALKAYVDGYASAQKSYAPLTLAIGTNNDVDVSRAAGVSWANNIVDPLASYASRYPGITVAGANDIEPGFSATVAQSKAWLTGYLSATTAKFVFNGSADGCSTITSGSGCNNGWSMTSLQWLAGGAAPTRIVDLPQIYNSAMPLQWKFISLTGTRASKKRLYFGGPLTEAKACAQAGSCGSISTGTAWNKLWSAISSSTSTKQYDMPHGTDLRIN
jgi:hypothetical protein